MTIFGQNRGGGGTQGGGAEIWLKNGVFWAWESLETPKKGVKNGVPPYGGGPKSWILTKNLGFWVKNRCKRGVWGSFWVGGVF